MAGTRLLAACDLTVMRVYRAPGTERTPSADSSVRPLREPYSRIRFNPAREIR